MSDRNDPFRRNKNTYGKKLSSMDRFNPTAQQAPPDRHLCAVVGADDLISRVFRGLNHNGKSAYRFDVRRTDCRCEAAFSFTPKDLRGFVKLTQVLAFAIVDDGWLSAEERRFLINLFSELDEITRRWDAA